MENYYYEKIVAVLAVSFLCPVQLVKGFELAKFSSSEKVAASALLAFADQENIPKSPNEILPNNLLLQNVLATEESSGGGKIISSRYCSICDYTFKHRNGLTKHLVVHDMEKMKQLKKARGKILLCQEGTCVGRTFFTSKNHLNEHSKKIHQKQQIVCAFCNKELSNKANLSRHKKICKKNPIAFMKADEE